MDIAVLSDIHGNHIALRACIEYVISKNIKSFIFLGDYVGEFAYPQKTMQILYEINRQYQCYFVKGNKEDYWLNYRSGGPQKWKDNDSTTGSLLYTYGELMDSDFEFFETLSISKKIIIEAMPAITLCHGSPYNVSEKLLPNNERTKEIMKSADTDFILCGHTHIQGKIEYDEKVVLNPGSVGIPLCGNGQSQFMILHDRTGCWIEEFVSLNYDVEETVKELTKSKLYERAPYWTYVTEYVLRGGNTSHGEVLNRAMELCRDEKGICIWPDVPEKFWRLAIQQLTRLP